MLDAHRQEKLDPPGLAGLYASTMDLAQWVRDARKHKKLTLEALGELLNLTKGNIYHWEHGNHQPSYQQIVAIAEITGYPMPQADKAPAAEQPKDVQALSGHEGMLIAYFRMLDPAAREAITLEVQERAAAYKVAPQKRQRNG